MTFFRRLIADSLDALPPGHNMTGLIELDVTDTRRQLRELRRLGRGVSLFAFIIKSIASVLKEYPELNAVRGRKNIVYFDDVDVNLPVETVTPEGKFPRQIIIRQTDRKSLKEIQAEIDNARGGTVEGFIGDEDKRAVRMMRSLFLIPRFIRHRLIRSASRNPYRVKEMVGTTFITAVGMFANIPGYVVPYMTTPRAVTFAMGSVNKRPVMAGDKPVNREFLSMTVHFNHDIVDGAPAARFMERFKKTVERGEVLGSDQSPA
jgi:pyruvate/2-oxoglutarate dehydrogenase complex dihydrolipoamide acyltransferase (E2) component